MHHRLIVALLPEIEGIGEILVESCFDEPRLGERLSKSRDDSLMRTSAYASMQQGRSSGVKHGIIHPAYRGFRPGGGQERFRLSDTVLCSLEMQVRIFLHAGIPSSLIAR